jgi:hypothetical protein
VIVYGCFNHHTQTPYHIAAFNFYRGNIYIPLFAYARTLAEVMSWQLGACVAHVTTVPVVINVNHCSIHRFLYVTTVAHELPPLPSKRVHGVSWLIYSGYLIMGWVLRSSSYVGTTLIEYIEPLVCCARIPVAH